MNVLLDKNNFYRKFFNNNSENIFKTCGKIFLSNNNSSNWKNGTKIIPFYRNIGSIEKRKKF